ncbi:MAG: hypothetical protein AB7E85_00865 [Pseudobdellovibrionaceae bacterium]
MSDTTAFPNSVPVTTASRISVAHRDQQEYGTHPLISFTKAISAQSFTHMREAVGLSQEMCGQIFARRSTYWPSGANLLEMCEAIGVHPAHLVDVPEDKPAPSAVVQACLLIFEGRYSGADRYQAESLLDLEMVKSKNFATGSSDHAQILRDVEKSYIVHRETGVENVKALVEDSTLRTLFAQAGIQLPAPTTQTLPRSEKLSSLLSPELAYDTEDSFEMRAMSVLEAEKELIRQKPAKIEEISDDIKLMIRKRRAILQSLYTPDQLKDSEAFTRAFQKLQIRMQSRHKDDQAAFLQRFVENNLDDFMPMDRMAGIRVQKMGYDSKEAAFTDLLSIHTNILRLKRTQLSEERACTDLETQFCFLADAMQDETAMGFFENLFILKTHYAFFEPFEIEDPDFAAWNAKMDASRRPR